MSADSKHAGPARFFYVLFCATALSWCLPAAAEAGSASALRARHAELASQLASNQFGRPLVLDSTESSRQLKGDVYAVVNYPYATVNKALNDATHWCDVLILHLNTKYCKANGDTRQAAMQVAIGKKFDQPLDDAYKVDFTYRAAAATADYFQIEMDAKKGPLGTSNYQITLEAVALPANKTFIHMTYAYSYNFAASIAMQGYLATGGSNKVGFTRDGAGYIGGVRGVVERNTMRYYLAIDAYLAGLSAPAAGQLDKRLQAWFAATERYPRQLREIDRETYMAMKRKEVARQQGAN